MRRAAVLVAGFLLLAGAPARAEEADWGRTRAESLREIGSGDPEARLRAVKRLGKFDSLESVKLLVDLLGNQDPVLRKAEQEQETFQKEYMASVERFNKMVANQKGMVSTAEAEQMAKTEMKMRELSDRVFDLSQYPREIARALGETKNAPAVEWLVKIASTDSQESVRGAVATALGTVDAAGVDPGPCLHKMTQDKSPRVRSAAVDSLRMRRAPGSHAVLVGALEDEHWQVRAAAAEALGAEDDRTSVKPLIERLQKEPGRMREDIARALHLLTGVDLGGDAKAWKGWWETNGAAWEAGSLEKKKTEAGSARGEEPGKTTVFFGIETKSKNIVFVLDISGSMAEKAGKPATVESGPDAVTPKGDRKIDVARAEIHRAINLLPADAVFNLIFYSGEVKVLSAASMTATETNKTKARKFIDGLEPDGGTNIHDALERAFHLLRKKEDNYDKGADTIFFLTDGQPTVGKLLDREKILAVVRDWNQDRRIRIHAIGVGDHDGDLMKRLAEQNGGTYVAR